MAIHRDLFDEGTPIRIFCPEGVIAAKVVIGTEPGLAYTRDVKGASGEMLEESVDEFRPWSSIHFVRAGKGPQS